MTNRKSSNSRPTYRVSFARIIGQDDNGDRLGAAREIGAIWPREKGGGILRLDHIPVELTQHQGVLFVTPVEAQDRGFA